ncbi:glycosyltransferase [Caulobacter segnis]|uniref:glycosyltransferase n=1 Tax=Caulobacter segnis TaxID=88688 RepID=UPI0026EC3393|nr:glycosyltransferase [Caulobacter segnis]
MSHGQVAVDDIARDGRAASSARPRLLFFLPGLAMGGAERQTLELMFGLRERGFPTKLLVFGPMTSALADNVLAEERYAQLDAKGMLRPLGWWRAWRALRRERTDIVVAVNQTPAVLAVAIGRALRATWATVVIFHTTLLMPRERARHGLFEWATRAARALVFVSQNQAAYWKGKGLRSPAVHTIRNGVDLARFQPDVVLRRRMRERLGFADQTVVFGLLATFRPEKAHLDAIDAFSRVVQSGADARLILVGDGPTRPMAERRAAARGVADRVIFAGEQEDVRPWLAALDVGLLCSTAVETFSLAALEILATGAPMVMSDIGGASEIVTDGHNGLLYPAGDKAALTKALAALLEPDLRRTLGANARPSVLRFSRERMLDDYQALFEGMQTP